MYDSPSILPQITRRASLAGVVGRRFAARPFLHDTATRLLKAELDTAYPKLNLDIERLALVTPIYQDAEYTHFQGYECSNLVWVLVIRYIWEEPFNFIEGFHFITDQVGAEQPRQLPLQLVDVERWIDSYGPLLMEYFRADLVQYWNHHDTTGLGQWAWLADHLRNAAMAAGTEARDANRLSEAHVAQLNALAQPNAQGKAGTGFIELSTPGILPGLPPEINPCLVVPDNAGQQPGQGAWLSYSPFLGAQHFADPTLLERYIRRWVQPNMLALRPNITVQAPVGDAFSAMARRLLEQQLAQLSRLREHLADFPTEATELTTWCGLLTGMNDLDHAQRSHAARVIDDHLPVWLKQASARDKRHYASDLGRLAISHEQGITAVLLNGIEPIETYAAQRLEAQMRLDHPQGPWPRLSDVDIQLLTVPNALLNIVNAGDSQLQVRHISWVDLALSNLASRPEGALHVQAAPGKELPVWCDAAEVQRLVQAVDIGGTYITLLRQRLTGATADVTARRDAFASQLKIQLPLLALENKLQSQGGMDDEGVRLIRSAMDGARSSLARARLFRLALQAWPQGPLDVARGVYVIATHNGSDGPRLLYTPLGQPMLRQFASQHALDEALRGEPALRGFVLAWLADDVRARYANGGLDEPHLVRFGQGSEFAPLQVPAPAAVREQLIEGPWEEALYGECVAALISVADRRSVSNQENEWISYRQLGWVLFNGLLPVLSGPVATVGWMLQALHDLGDTLQALDDTRPGRGQEAFNALLFNLAFYLFSEALHASSRRVPPPLPAVDSEPGLAMQWAAPAPLDAPTVASPLALAWAEPFNQLSNERRQALMALRAPAPSTLSSAVPTGPAWGLVLDGQRLCVYLPQGWFDVAVADQAGTAVILDPATGEPSGPPLRRDEAGRWQLDLSLRLRGGQVRAVGGGREPVTAFKLRFNAWLDEARAQSNKMLFTYGLMNKALESERPGRFEEVQRFGDSYNATGRRAIEESAALEQAMEQLNRRTVVPEFAHRLVSLKQARIALLADVVRTRQLQLAVAALERAEGRPPAFKETLQDATYVAYLSRSSGWMDEMVELNGRLDEECERLAQVPGTGAKVRDALLPELALMPAALDWRGARLQTWGNLALRELLDSGAEHEVVFPYLRQGRDAVRHFDDELNAIAGRSPDGSNPWSWADCAARLDKVASELIGAHDGLAFYRDGQASLAGAEYLGKVLDELQALRKEVEAELDDALEGDLRERRLERKRQRKASRRQYKTSHGGQAPGRQPGPSRPSGAEGSGQRRDYRDMRPEELADSMAQLRLEPVHTVLNAMVQEAEQRLAEAPGLIARARRWLSPDRIATEMEDLLANPAKALEELANKIDRAVGQQNLTDTATQAGSAERLARRLNNEAANLRAAGRELRIDTYLQGKPTAAALQYLHAHGKVQLAVPGPARPVGNKGHGDQLREAVISDLQGAPLWYAHFHYDKAGHLMAAHLKLPGQRLLGLQSQRKQAQSGQPVTAIYRGLLPEAVVQALFPQALRLQ